MLGSSELSPDQEIKNVETLVNQRVDGLIISPLQGDDVDLTYIVDLMKENYPLVLLGSVKNILTNAVDINNTEASYKAVSYLIDSGHQNIAYFAGPTYSIHSVERLSGYQKALIEFHVPYSEKNIIQTGSHIENGYEKGKALFSEFNDKSPTAVFCYNDLVAIGLINALIDLKIQVPEQVSVIGFDDINFCDSFRIPLTTVRVPAYKIGAVAADLLLKQIIQGSKSSKVKKILEADIIKRSTCTKLKKNS